MKKIFLPLGLFALIVAPSAGSAKLVLDIPPILAGTSNSCLGYAGCPSGPCYPECAATDPCQPCCAADCDPCSLSCENPCTSCVAFNDTGITASVATGDDAQNGRDADDKTKSNEDGLAGFSFTKLDSSCVALTDQSQTSFAFAKDNVTGLIWEIQNDPPEKSWYNENNSTNGGDAGAVNDDNNTQQYVQTANTSQWCGKTTWRLPTVKELFGLVNSSKKNMAVDQNYFPNINLTNGFFWSATPRADVATRAWAVRFTTGQPVNYLKSSAYSVMLVRDAD